MVPYRSVILLQELVLVITYSEHYKGRPQEKLLGLFFGFLVQQFYKANELFLNNFSYTMNAVDLVYHFS